MTIEENAVNTIERAIAGLQFIEQSLYDAELIQAAIVARAVNEATQKAGWQLAALREKISKVRK